MIDIWHAFYELGKGVDLYLLTNKDDKFYCEPPCDLDPNCLLRVFLDLDDVKDYWEIAGIETQTALELRSSSLKSVWNRRLTLNESCHSIYDTGLTIMISTIAAGGPIDVDVLWSPDLPMH